MERTLTARFAAAVPARKAISLNVSLLLLRLTERHATFDRAACLIRCRAIESKTMSSLGPFGPHWSEEDWDARFGEGSFQRRLDSRAKGAQWLGTIGILGGLGIIIACALSLVH